MASGGKGPFEIHKEIDTRLGHFEDMGDITHMERDALRHYYVSKAVAKKYGIKKARIGTWLHEYGIDNLIPGGGDMEQTRIDFHNNEIAFKHVEGNMGDDFDLTQTTLSDLKKTLPFLTVPPKIKSNY